MCVYISVHISHIKWVTNEHVTKTRLVTQGRFLEGTKEKCGKELCIIYSLSCELNCRRKYKACVGKMSNEDRVETKTEKGVVNAKCGEKFFSPF